MASILVVTALAVGSGLLYREQTSPKSQTTNKPPYKTTKPQTTPIPQYTPTPTKLVVTPRPQATPQAPIYKQKSCKVEGCSGELCYDPSLGGDIATTCIYKEEYACYKLTTCERQQDGSCGWTKTPDFTKCIASQGGY